MEDGRLKIEDGGWRIGTLFLLLTTKAGPEVTINGDLLYFGEKKLPDEKIRK